MNDTVVAGQKIAVWFSCGAASAVAAKLTLTRYRDICDVQIVNNPIMEEDVDNRRFLRDVEIWLDHPITMTGNVKWSLQSAESVWRKRKYMAGNDGAPCTYELKKLARQQWEKIHAPDWHVLGFTFDERTRYENFILTERSNVLPVLIDEKITKEDCFDLIRSVGIELPLSYRKGYPNANCIGCPKATSPTYWNHVRRMDSDVFDSRAKLSRELGARLVRFQGKRIFLDELPADARGRPMKTLKSPDCGIFCEERR